ncbi:CAP domain-containing protein [Georgenia satyanarayanai]|uniref:CAP domain-containing protein n=1 Tax=Georgenia satyanarayanai TaxID=860221 RepID=UPI00203B0017|nr:CAP domain-containing protein [Georgenia satyanarayanai]MCM3661074.1 CAP domain-containing protein [Georgenia satyanarayanai]
MKMMRRRLLAAALTVGLTAVAAPAVAKGGEVDGEGPRYHLTNTWAGITHLSFGYGRDDDAVYVGNWDGKGTDTLAVRRGATFHFRNSLSSGVADRVVTYGRPGDVVLMGDWNGDGIDTPTVRRGNVYYVKNSLDGGAADVVVAYGSPEDVVLVGDWDGDGTDTLGVRRGSTYYLKNSMSGGNADRVVAYGHPSDDVIVGNWDGRGGDSLGVRRGDVFHLKNTIAGGAADIVMPYGGRHDGVLVGDWDGNGTDTIGLRNAVNHPVPPRVGSMAEYDERMVEMINAERAARGIAPVRVVPALRAAAVRHSTWMAGKGVIQHASRETALGEAQAAGCDRSGSEHIVRTYQRGTAPDPRDAMNWYMNSTVHRSGILNPTYSHVAVGTVQAGDMVYNTQRFVRNCS